MDQLTLETLRPVPRVILDIVSQFKPRCSHVSRGCTENVQVEELLLHEETCGYAPVVCSNEGCNETVNRRDKESHEMEECKFRKITCESCDEELVYADYEKHPCALRKEINETKLHLGEVSKSLNRQAATQTKVLEKLQAIEQSIKDLPDTLRRATSSTTVVNGQIFIFGGCQSDVDSKSIEIFNWSTKTWTLITNCLFFQRCCSFSFVHGKKIMICGGKFTESIEYLNPSESGYTSTLASVSLPRDVQHNGLLYKDRILTFVDHVAETSLESPGESRILLEENQDRGVIGVHCFGNNIYIVGGQNGSMEKYDVANNEMKILPSMPNMAFHMATVAYKDNIIILGGARECEYKWKALNDVLIFNVTTHEYKRLPSMREKRIHCAAVITGEVIVAMGGFRGGDDLDTVEYYVIGDSEWQELPAMNLERFSATACVYV